MKLFGAEEDLKHFIITFFGIKIRLSKKGIGKFTPPTEVSGHPILESTDANECVYKLLSENKPCFIARFGNTESLALKYWRLYKDEKGQCEFPDYIRNEMRYLSGFFTPTSEYLSRYCLEVFEAIKNFDMLGFMCGYHKNGVNEGELIEGYAKDDIKIVNSNIFTQDVLGLENPWTRILEGKKVLVIHPFEKTIKSQYKKREKLFKNPLVLPEFSLETIKTVQGLEPADSTDRFENWFNALEYMYRQIEEKDFDIALVAGGAFGMLFANHIKQMGKQAILACGQLQLLFGIKGARWNNRVGEFYNDFWVSPLPEERPSDLTNFVSVEGNVAYW